MIVIVKYDLGRCNMRCC